MPRITVEIEKSDLAYLEAELADGRGPTINDLLTQAIKDYQRARGLEELDRLVEEAMESESIEITPDYWERKKQEFLARRRAAVS